VTAARPGAGESPENIAVRSVTLTEAW